MAQKLRWRHIVIGTLRSWLHGDERGFRSRRHRVHSSGDDNDPPPPGEHAGLHRYHADGAGDPVDLHLDVRVIICEAFVR